MIRTLGVCLVLIVLGAAAAIAQERGSALELYRQGREAQSRMDRLRAVELYRAALLANPDYLQPMVGLAETFLELEEYREALEHVTRSRKYDHGNLELLNLEGRIRVGLGQSGEARRLFEAVLARETNNLEARFGLAELDISLGFRGEAGRRYLETLKLRPDSEKALLSLALLEDSQGNREAAASYLELALRYHGNDPRVHYTAGSFALQGGDAERAEQHLRLAVGLDDRHVEARRLLAQALLAQDKSVEAVRTLQSVLAYERDNPLVWYTLGTAHERAGDTQAALNSLARVLQLRPDDEIARLALENLLLEKFPINDPVRQKYGRYRVEQGRLFANRNLLGRALVEYRRAVMLDPEAKQPRLEYGQVFMTQGYPDKYRRELVALRFLGHEDPVILDDLEIIESRNWEMVSARWGIDQYALNKRRVSVRVFHLTPRSRELHPGAGAVAASFFRDLLRGNEAVDMQPSFDQPAQEGAGIAAGEASAVNDFPEAFRLARESRADYFLLLWVEESERSFTVHLEQYRASTGKLLASERVYRTGNDRVLESMSTLARRFVDALPLKGTLLERRFARGVADLGRLDGLAVGDRLVIVKRGAVRLDQESIGFVYEEQDRVGELTVTEVDENLAEGTIVRGGFFDLINPGDELLRPALPRERPPQAEPEPQAPEGLIRRLFRLVGWEPRGS